VVLYLTMEEYEPQRKLHTIIERGARTAALVGLTVLAACSSTEAEPIESPTPTATTEQGKPKAPEETKAAVDDIGYDISFPQCGQPLPQPGAFAIVGINGELPSLFNPCSRRQIEWAKQSSGQTSQPKVAVYVTAANPGNEPGDNGAAHIPNWPLAGANRYGVCDNGDTEACAFQYGKARAEADIKHIPLKIIRKLWIDVEPEYSWSHQPGNRAALEAMVETFDEAGLDVGIYSSNDILKSIVGNVSQGSSLYGLENWMLGARSVGQARQNCQLPSFTNGKVTVAQIVGGVVDQNVAC
jgi:hypothetical protein